jgi:hypothetical protein
MIRSFFLFSFAVLSAACSRSPETSQETGTVKTDHGWINTNRLEAGELKHDTLSQAQMADIERLHSIFSEVDGADLASWVEDFKRDADPNREIAIWEAMAVAYEGYCEGKELDIKTKKEVYMLVLLRSSAEAGEVLKHIQLRFLSKQEALKVMDGYKMEAMPIRVNEGS